MQYIQVPQIPFNEDDYKRDFNKTNKHWFKDSNQFNNYFFLKMHQNYFNNRLETRGYVFLNEVLELLGFVETNVGAVVGWTKDDGYVDFGCWDEQDVDADSIALSFNVQGVIVGKL